MMEAFEDALMALIDKHIADGEDPEEIVSAMELRVMAMNEAVED